MTETIEARPDTAQETAQGGQGGTDARRGRPRPQETMARDDQVVTLLREGPKTTAQLAEALGVDSGIAYLCIYRLKKAGRVVKTQGEAGGRSPAWKLTDQG